jgi:hypothetical protein
MSAHAGGRRSADQLRVFAESVMQPLREAGEVTA